MGYCFPIKIKPRWESSTGKVLFFSERPVFVQQEVYREAQDVIDEGHCFLGDAAHMDPQKGEQTAQADASETIDHIHLHKGFFPGCTGGAEHIAPVKQKSPGHKKSRCKKYFLHLLSVIDRMNDYLLL